MTQDKNDGNRWYADKGKLIRCTIDNQIMGDEIYLTGKHGNAGEKDSIDNYDEVDNPDYNPNEEESDAPVE